MEEETELSEIEKLNNEVDAAIENMNVEMAEIESIKDKKTGLESLQFPVYCGVRELGKEPSYEQFIFSVGALTNGEVINSYIQYKFKKIQGEKKIEKKNF